MDWPLNSTPFRQQAAYALADASGDAGMQGRAWEGVTGQGGVRGRWMWAVERNEEEHGSCCLSLYDLMQSCAQGEAGRLSQAKVRHEASSRTRSLLVLDILRAAGADLIPRFAAASGDSLRPRRTS
jgi:hypothetical protein